ncbi:unnamed protein product [Leuciscus chuanchicus]
MDVKKSGDGTTKACQSNSVVQPLKILRECEEQGRIVSRAKGFSSDMGRGEHDWDKNGTEKSAEPSVFGDSEEKPRPRTAGTPDSCVQRVVTFKVQLISPSASCDECLHETIASGFIIRDADPSKA